jgi:hypothetical protein
MRPGHDDREKGYSNDNTLGDQEKPSVAKISMKRRNLHMSIPRIFIRYLNADSDVALCDLLRIRNGH